MLRILALETSGLTGSVAAAIDDKVLAEIDLGPRQRSAQSLAPAIKAILEQLGWQPRDVGLVAVTAGPGSFTGLRVGVATAKVFAYATKAEVLGISTLEVIAAAAPRQIEKLSAAIDAQRGDVVAQDFQRLPAGGLEPLGPDRLMPFADWLAGLPPGFAISGPVLKKWSEPFPPGIEVVPPELWQPTAANVARLAHRDYCAGRRDDPWRLLPVYSRPSAAEEKWVKPVASSGKD
jgi:tRNA threonylcarbamoyladenosine biosynthesis protein TsaB